MNMSPENPLINTHHDAADLPVLLIGLFKGVLYQENDPGRWNHLLTLQSQIRDYVVVLGLELILDEAEGYAFLRARQHDNDSEETQPDESRTPRLIARRPLSFPVSLLLALLRKKLAESDASAGDTRLILTRDDIVELIRIFLPASSNEAKLVDQLDRHINKVIELGFLRRLTQNNTSQQPNYEVRRVIKAFVDAQWLGEFDRKLEQYQLHLTKNRDD